MPQYGYSKSLSYELWDGNIDEVRIWDDSRTGTGILNNMNCPLTGTESNLIAYWDLEEGSGTTITDKAQNDTAYLSTGATWSSDQALNCNIGIAETDRMIDIKISPNPIQNHGMIHCEVALKDATLTLYDLLGRTIKRMSHLHGQSITIDRETLPAGKYLITFQEGSTFTKTLPIVFID